MARLFGTDGVRGTANQELTAELVLELSVAAAHVLGESGIFGLNRPTAIVGRDPRASGEFLEAAVVAGLASAGIDVERVGIVPTPGLAFLVADRGCDLGVMLSASHNPMPDNGVKFFARGGVKLPDDIEDAIEAQMGDEWKRPIGDQVGRVVDSHTAVRDYIRHLVASLDEDRTLDGLNVVLDCANGASSVTAREAFVAAGANVTTIHDTIDGISINLNCGSTHMESLQHKVTEIGADVGFAFDGDADRCLAVDASGTIVDGDQIMASLAIAMKNSHKLASDTLVATIMSNLGLIKAMESHGIKIDQTKVGDRYVLESMSDNGFTLGGEQSGHVIMSEFATTGDGVLTALHIAQEMVKSGKPLAQLASVSTRLPQVLINVTGVDKLRAGIDTGVMRAVAEANAELGDSGRVVLRPSGTEPMVRVMVEAATEAKAQEVCQRLASVVSRRLRL